MDETTVRRGRVVAQGLAERGDRAAVDVVRSLLAVQAQELRSARLAVRARSSAAEGLDAALEERSVVIGWLLRGTLHAVAAEDWAWLHALTAPRQATGSARRLGQLGVAPDDVDRAVALIARATAGDGPLSREELGARLAAAGIPTAGQALPHLLGAAALRGEIVVVGEHRYAHARSWLGDAEVDARVDRDAALAELARRYLAAHAPATDADLAAWAGLPLRDARAGLAAAGAPSPEPPPGAPLPPRLLPPFDPYLLGWKDRAFAVPPAHAKRVFPGGGALRATVVADGLAVATWSLRAGRVTVDPFDGATLPDLADEVADVEAFSAG